MSNPVPTNWVTTNDQRTIQHAATILGMTVGEYMWDATLFDARKTLEIAERMGL